MIQQELFPMKKNKLSFGGKSTKGSRKIARTIYPNKWIHLCLKSSKAIGIYSLWHKHKRSKIESLIRTKARENQVELKEAVNMGNHIHLKIKVKTSQNFKKFLRSIAGQIARIVTGAKKGKKFGKFWDALAFTRVLTTTFEVLQLKGYFEANRIERKNGYQARADALKQFNRWLYGYKQKIWLTST